MFVIGARLFSFVFIAVVKFRSNRFKIDRNSNNDIRIKVKPIFEGWGMVVVILVVVGLVGVGGVGIIVWWYYDDIMMMLMMSELEELLERGVEVEFVQSVWNMGGLRESITSWTGGTWGWFLSGLIGQLTLVYDGYCWAQRDTRFADSRSTLCFNFGIFSLASAIMLFEYRTQYWAVWPKSESRKCELTCKRLQLSADVSTRSSDRYVKLSVVDQKITRRINLIQEARLLNKKGVLIKEHYLQIEKVSEQVTEFLMRQKNYYITFIEKMEKAHSVGFGSMYHSVTSLFESVGEFIGRSNSVMFVIGARLCSFVFIVMVKFFLGGLKSGVTVRKYRFYSCLRSGIGVFLVVCCVGAMFLVRRYGLVWWGWDGFVPGYGTMPGYGKSKILFVEPPIIKEMKDGFLVDVTVLTNGVWGWFLSGLLWQGVSMWDGYYCAVQDRILRPRSSFFLNVAVGRCFGTFALFNCRTKYWAVWPKSERRKCDLTGKRLDLSVDFATRSVNVQNASVILDQKIAIRASLIKEAQFLQSKGLLVKEHYLQVEKVGQNVSKFLREQKYYYFIKLFEQQGRIFNFKGVVEIVREFIVNSSIEVIFGGFRLCRVVFSMLWWRVLLGISKIGALSKNGVVINKRRRWGGVFRVGVYGVGILVFIVVSGLGWERSRGGIGEVEFFHGGCGFYVFFSHRWVVCGFPVYFVNKLIGDGYVEWVCINEWRVMGLGGLCWGAVLYRCVYKPYHRWVMFKSQNLKMELLEKVRVTKAKAISEINDRNIGIDRKVRFLDGKIAEIEKITAEMNNAYKSECLLEVHFIEVKLVVQGVRTELKWDYIILVEQAEKVRSLSSIYHGVVSLFESVVEFVSRSNSVVFVIGARLVSFVFIAIVKVCYVMDKVKGVDSEVQIKITKQSMLGWVCIPNISFSGFVPLDIVMFGRIGVVLYTGVKDIRFDFTYRWRVLPKSRIEAKKLDTNIKLNREDLFNQRCFTERDVEISCRIKKVDGATRRLKVVEQKISVRRDLRNQAGSLRDKGKLINQHYRQLWYRYQHYTRVLEGKKMEYRKVIENANMEISTRHKGSVFNNFVAEGAVSTGVIWWLIGLFGVMVLGRWRSQWRLKKYGYLPVWFILGGYGRGVGLCYVVHLYVDRGVVHDGEKSGLECEVWSIYYSSVGWWLWGLLLGGGGEFRLGGDDKNRGEWRDYFQLLLCGLVLYILLIIFQGESWELWGVYDVQRCDKTYKEYVLKMDNIWLQLVDFLRGQIKVDPGYVHRRIKNRKDNLRLVQKDRFWDRVAGKLRVSQYNILATKLRQYEVEFIKQELRWYYKAKLRIGIYYAGHGLGCLVVGFLFWWVKGFELIYWFGCRVFRISKEVWKLLH
jgi:hypothetical protein